MRQSAAVPARQRYAIRSVRDRAIRVAGVVDFAPPAGQAWVINERTGLLETLAPLTWTGIRIYHFPGGPKRVLRRWEQVGSPGHLETQKSLVATQGHPMRAGQPVNVHATNARGLQVGHTGDEIIVREVRGYMVPYSRTVITSAHVTQLIQGTPERPGLTQTSQGYVAMLDETGGQWDGPEGLAAFDIEHVLDPLDPRVLALVEETANDPQPFLAESLGGNHFAVALERGRGADLSELVAPVQDSPDQPRNRSRVYMHRDAAGMEPTPIESETPVTEKAKTKVQVRLTLDGFVPKCPHIFDVDPEVAAGFAMVLTEMSAKLAEMAAALSGAEAATVEAEAGAEQAQAAQATAEGAQVAAEGAQAEAVTATEEMRDGLTKAEAKIVELETELAPHRTAGLADFRESAKRVHDADYSALTTEAAIKAAAVEGRDAKYKGAPALVVDALFDTWSGSPKHSKRAASHKTKINFDNQPRARATGTQPKPSRGASVLDRLNPQAPN